MKYAVPLAHFLAYLTTMISGRSKSGPNFCILVQESPTNYSYIHENKRYGHIYIRNIKQRMA